MGSLPSSPSPLTHRGPRRCASGSPWLGGGRGTGPSGVFCSYNLLMEPLSRLAFSQGWPGQTVPHTSSLLSFLKRLAG